MTPHLLTFESELLGAPVLALSPPEPGEDLAAAERAWTAAHHPLYVECKLPLDDTRSIHGLEDLGFRFLETLYRLSCVLAPSYPEPLPPYVFERVTRAEDLPAVYRCARASLTSSRWHLDPALPDAPALAARRYERFLESSFQRADERLFRGINRETGETVAFYSHRILPDRTALLFLGGVSPEHQGTGVGGMVGYSQYNELIREGVTRFTTHVSGSNLTVLNLEVGRLKYKLQAAYAVLRKIYPAPSP